jgi:hypothetical protein
MQMASSLVSSLTMRALFLLLVHISFSFNNLAAKHSNHATHRHRYHNHSPNSNPRLHQAYIALQAWKHVIYSDPKNSTINWVGPSVCSYKGVFCAPALDDPKITVVAGIDLNSADLAGFLPYEIGLLSDIALIHLNSNRFCGIIPESLANLTLLFELDLSNNRFVGPFPFVVLSLPTLNFLDIRYNEFEGPLPAELFNKKLDAIFVNNNNFTSMIPPNFGTTSASVVVFANNQFGGCLPSTISKFANTLEELVLINNNLTGCLPQELGYLYKLKVLDVSSNSIVGPIPYSLAGLAHLELLNLGHNMLSGIVIEGVCQLPSLTNFTFSNNFFCEEQGVCQNLTSRKGLKYDERRNCLPEKPFQRSAKECNAALEHPVDCFEHPCTGGGGGGVGGGTVFAPAAAPATVPVSSPSMPPGYT